MWSNTIILPWGEPFTDMQEDLDKLRSDKRKASFHAECSQPMDLVATGYPSPQKLARFDHHWICVQIAKYRDLLWQIIKFTQRTGFWNGCKPSQGEQTHTMRKLGNFLAWNKISHQSLCVGGVHLRFPFPITGSQCFCLLHVPSLRCSLHHCLSVAWHLIPDAPGPLSSFFTFLWAENFPSQAGFPYLMDRLLLPFHHSTFQLTLFFLTLPNISVSSRYWRLYCPV